MLNFLYTEGRKKWRGRGKHSTDAGHRGDRCWPWCLSAYPSSASCSGGDRRGGARATDADVSVCRSVHEDSIARRPRRTLASASVDCVTDASVGRVRKRACWTASVVVEPCLLPSDGRVRCVVAEHIWSLVRWGSTTLV
jgi:hypothetical protein